MTINGKEQRIAERVGITVDQVVKTQMTAKEVNDEIAREKLLAAAGFNRKMRAPETQELLRNEDLEPVEIAIRLFGEKVPMPHVRWLTKQRQALITKA